MSLIQFSDKIKNMISNVTTSIGEKTQAFTTDYKIAEKLGTINQAAGEKLG